MNYYIFNPYANNGQINYKLNKFDKKRLISTENSKALKSLKRKLKKDDIIYFIGGDGTLCYILNNYHFLSNYQINYVAMGTGNDFNKSLNTNQAYLYTINKDYHFINSFGIGFDALVCHKVNNQTKKSKSSYLKQSYLSLKEFEPISLDISYNNQNYHYDNVWLCSLQNGHYFGGGLNIAKDADITKEEVDLCIGYNCNIFNVLILLFFVKIGKTHWFKNHFFTIKAKDITIKNHSVILSQIDGDTAYLNDDITITNKTLINIRKSSLDELMKEGQHK
ncbi:MAG: hypothetical protein LBT75_00620 [Bacilli bacterium]|jgi:diacylglycerol kinase family enzyme|nr:hypothetical protein [Bacilli bacterium]